MEIIHLKLNDLNELQITLDAINLAILWGAQNEHFDYIKKQYPKLRIVARGNEMKVLGDEKQLESFKNSFDDVINHLEKYNKLSLMDLENLMQTTSGSAVLEEKMLADKAASVGSEPIVFGPNGIIVRARTPNQRKMVDSITNNDILFAIGPAGTGKTYTAVALAVRALRNKEIKRIILTRPAVEAGENLGFLPGDLKEKVDPYLRPLYDALDDMIPAEKLKGYLENRTIEVAPLAFMRGRTLDNCFVILDEAQNATDMQLKMFLTRMGPTAKFIVTGDVTQIDLPRKNQSGLATAVRLLDNIEGIDIIHLNGSDVVRHKLVKRILEAYGDI
ncbi:phosphate starvation-inducible PhoH-like protein [Sphingobacterium sp. JUb78]|jgi:phosphate starvation-inducible PhoH-like protein|nr:phosphate starvation-inducible PhoH-like protein [Sphingobacterium kitahiroshimense]TCR02425.1 phosphate starvation-inducible PhoH-like protein [Sphingobacterium sp. JUb20]TCR07842.1 phosphate starvation-inducible PhoH-like protein [Sphingobacterium sp. JUb78]